MARSAHRLTIWSEIAKQNPVFGDDGFADPLPSRFYDKFDARLRAGLRLSGHSASPVVEFKLG